MWPMELAFSKYKGFFQFKKYEHIVKGTKVVSTFGTYWRGKSHLSLGVNGLLPIQTHRSAQDRHIFT